MDIQKQVVVHVCGFDGVQRGKYFGGEPIKRTDDKVVADKVLNLI